MTISHSGLLFWGPPVCHTHYTHAVEPNKTSV